MSNLTLEIIDNYVQKNKPHSTIELDYGDFIVTVKSSITIYEKMQFIEHVIEDAYIEYTKPSRARLEAAFDATFLGMLTDIPLPTVFDTDGETVVNSQATFEIMEGLRIKQRLWDEGYTLYDELKNHVNERFKFENEKRLAILGVANATSEAIETVSALAHKGIEFIEAATEQLNKNGDKLFKNLTPKKIEKWLEGFQKAMVQPNSNVKAE